MLYVQPSQFNKHTNVILTAYCDHVVFVFYEDVCTLNSVIHRPTVTVLIPFLSEIA